MMRGSPEIAAALAFLTGIVALLVATLPRVGRHGLRGGCRPTTCGTGTRLRVFLMPPAGFLPASAEPGAGAGDRLAPPGGPGAAAGPPGRTGRLGPTPGPRPVPA